jgi:starch synthase (maltosyl-transferring)
MSKETSNVRLEEGRQRVIIEGVSPVVDCGRFAIKRVVGEEVVVEADAFTDGHDALSLALLYRQANESEWHEVPMEFLVNDRWRGAFTVSAVGLYCYTLLGWVDHFKSWARDLRKRVDAGQDVAIDLVIGAQYVEAAVKYSSGQVAQTLNSYAKTLRDGGDTAIQQALSLELAELMYNHAERAFAARYDQELTVIVDREKARYSAWYEFFPRSTAAEPGRHGTFRDAVEWLPYVSWLGFDVVYLPPIHPIGRINRKGKNNNVVAAPGDVGSPWAIGSDEGGHKAIHPQLGTLEDFRFFVEKVREHNMEVALDIAFQCAPDHPYVKEHPQWFTWRPDGTVQYAENPPKKYEDIYPINFETDDWRALWEELKSVMEYWVDQGVKIFRVDNPHTKSFHFWEWAIGEIKRKHPDTLFLAEAFTRPRVMYNLAKLGFSQSYTYFAWRTNKWELTQYMSELTQSEVRDYFRPNFWPNTPDILTEQLQFGGRPMFMQRFLLAATLTSNYGMYGPAFELGEHVAAPGKEEYIDNEKYEIKDWDLNAPHSIKDLIARVNHIRRENPALHSNESLRFHAIQNDQLLAYSKSTQDLSNIVLIVVNLDVTWTQSGWVGLPLEEFGLAADQPFEVHDLLTDARYQWHGSHNYVELSPALPAHIFSIRRQI